MENTLDRIKEYIDFKNISIRAFEISCGFSNGSFASQLKNRKTMGIDKVENILNIYKDINGHWLITGNGEMIRSEKYGLEVKENSLNEAGKAAEMYLNEIIKSKNEIIDGLKREIELLHELLHREKVEEEEE